jgi:hypothetical protein
MMQRGRPALLLVPLLVFLVAMRSAAEDSLPRFTEEREAAALFFVRKHAPEVLALLAQLKKDNLAQYQNEIREVFRVTELLADLEDLPRRHDLELKIWKAESRALALVARLATPNEEDRRKVEASLLELARELVDLDIQVLEWKGEMLDKEIGEIKDELARTRENIDKVTRSRYEGLVGKVRKPRK